MKTAPMVGLGLGCICLFGCSGSADVKTASNEFFEAFNHLCEADSLKAEGELDTMGLAGDFSAAFTSDPSGLSFIYTPDGAQPISFYIRDGRTYLDFMGTKSSSEAENIGIAKDQAFHIPNLFLDLSREDREKLFDQVKVDQDTYTFRFNTGELEKMLDGYGAVKVDRGQLKATLVDGQLEAMTIDVEGQFDVGTAQTDLDLYLEANFSDIDQPITIDYPVDLASWPSE